MSQQSQYPTLILPLLIGSGAGARLSAMPPAVLKTHPIPPFYFDSHPALPFVLYSKCALLATYLIAAFTAHNAVGKAVFCNAVLG